MENKKARIFFFSFAFFLWISTFGFLFFEGEGLLFFSLGVFFQKTNFNIEKYSGKISLNYWIIIFLLTAIIKTYLAFFGEMFLNKFTVFTLLILHKTAIFTGLIACWYASDKIVRWFMNKAWFV